MSRNWPELSLKSVVQPRKAKISPQDTETAPFLGLEHVEAHTTRILGVGRASEMKSAMSSFEAGDVLYGRLRPYLNKVARPTFSGAASAEFIVLPENQKIDGRFLQLLLSSGDFVSFASQINKGDRPRVDFDEIGEFKFRLPSRDEQRRVLVKLDSLLASSRAARDEFARIPKLLQRYKRAVLDSALRSSPNGRGAFRAVPFGEVIESTFYGPRIASEAYVQKGVPTLRTTDIGDWGRLDLKRPPEVAVTDNELEKWGFKDQDVMITRTGATIGKCALYEEVIGPALPSAYLIRVRLDRPKIMGRYALLSLLSSNGQAQLLAGRTAVAQPNINARAIASIQITLPPIDVQAEIVQKIDAAFESIDIAVSEHRKAEELLPRSEQALLSKAFRGELTT